MANLAVVGSHSTNGVAEIHSQLLRETTLKDLAEIFPGTFQQQNQRSHAPALAATMQSRTFRTDHRSHWRRVDHAT